MSLSDRKTINLSRQRKEERVRLTGGRKIMKGQGEGGMRGKRENRRDWGGKDGMKWSEEQE